jgi:cobalt-zinc-cadmium efflux system outer membrane protein
LPQLPLSEIAGQVDRFIPYYDYDEVRASVLQNHTDVLTARNTIQRARYALKLAQVTPVFPDFDVRYQLAKDFTVMPFGQYQQFALGFPLPAWDQNKGNIIAAQGALVRASEESHRVEVTLTNNLATAYGNYRNNLYAMEYYRRYILPDLVRYYRAVYARRQIDPASAFGDLVFAQQNFTTNVTTYIGILGSLWTSVVSVADFLQTDDLFQLAHRRELPELPDFQQLAHWACDHGTAAASCAPGAASASIPRDRAGTQGGGDPDALPHLDAPPPGGGETNPAPGPDGGPPPSPLAVPPPAHPMDPPPMPPNGPEGGATTERQRRGIPDTGPSAMIQSYFGADETRPGQPIPSLSAWMKSYVGTVGSRVSQAVLGPTAPVQPYFGAEESHAGPDH